MATKYDPKVPYLVNQIVIKNLTYQEVVIARPDLKASIDLYIIEKHLDIDKTV